MIIYNRPAKKLVGSSIFLCILMFNLLIEGKENGDHNVESKFLSIREKGIDVKPILQENFFVMTRDFISGLSPKENNITCLRSLTNIIEGYMNVLDKGCYEENREIGTKDVVADETIIKGLRLLEKEGKEVKLVNFYKGILEPVAQTKT